MWDVFTATSFVIQTLPPITNSIRLLAGVPAHLGGAAYEGGRRHALHAFRLQCPLRYFYLKRLPSNFKCGSHVEGPALGGKPPAGSRLCPQ